MPEALLLLTNGVRYDIIRIMKNEKTAAEKKCPACKAVSRQMKKLYIIAAVLMCLVLATCTQQAIENATTTHSEQELNQMIDELNNVIEAGEALPEELVNRFAEEFLRIIAAGEEDGLTEEQIYMWGRVLYEFEKNSRQTAQRIDDFDEIYDDLMSIIEVIERNHEIIAAERFSYTIFINEFHSENISITDQEIESLTRIMEAFGPGRHFRLDRIDVRPGRIAFVTENWQYGLVFTEDDSEPQFIVRPEDIEFMRIRVERIRPHWFHVFDDGRF